MSIIQFGISSTWFHQIHFHMRHRHIYASCVRHQFVWETHIRVRRKQLIQPRNSFVSFYLSCRESVHVCPRIWHLWYEKRIYAGNFKWLSHLLGLTVRLTSNLSVCKGSKFSRFENAGTYIPSIIYTTEII